jgi:hypothetical protein
MHIANTFFQNNNDRLNNNNWRKKIISINYNSGNHEVQVDLYKPLQKKKAKVKIR